MGFFGLCESDPLLDFIRETFSAVPLKIPETRVKPLTLFTVIDKRVRYLGELKNLFPSDLNWIAPRVEISDLPEVSKKISDSLSFDVAVDLLGPFMSEILAVTQLDVEAGLKSGQKQNEAVRLGLSKVQRSFVHYIACTALFESNTFQLPRGFDSEIGRVKSKPLYLVDAVLTAREIILMLEGDSATEEAVRIETGLAGKLSAENILRNKSKLLITGAKRATFAFTCLTLKVEESGVITGVEFAKDVPRFGATGMSSIQPVPHSILGGANELIAFDE